jgi:POT family proton-dependent oligopeptide transporter
LIVLFVTELWERFAYYGTSSLLVLYMVEYLLVPGHADAVLGYATIKRGLEFLFGPLATQPLGSQLFGFFTGLVYFTPLLGGVLADRMLGRRRMIVLGAMLLAVGYFLMAVDELFFIALLVLIIGNGAFKPNISSQVGELYPEGDNRIDRAYSIFYVSTNIGAFLAPLICGTIGERYGWHYGFVAAGVGMLTGLGCYLYGASLVPAHKLLPTKRDYLRLDRIAIIPAAAGVTLWIVRPRLRALLED